MIVCRGSGPLESLSSVTMASFRASLADATIMFVCLILMGGIEAAKLHKTVPSGLLPASGVQAAGGDETIEPDVIAIIDAQNTDEF